MSVTLPARMKAEEFVAWAMEQPEGSHYELEDGAAISMSPERSSHGIARVEVASKLLLAIRERGLPCDVYVDGMAARVSDETVYEPDIVVRCGKRLKGESTLMVDPVVIVEVLSPSTRSRDTTIKPVDYFRIPSLRHYVVLNAAKQTIVHYRREEGGEVSTRIAGDDALRLDPPGIVISDLFATRD